MENAKLSPLIPDWITFMSKKEVDSFFEEQFNSPKYVEARKNADPQAKPL